MQLFYNSEILENTIDFSFDKEESKHIVRVLRKNEGDILYVTNGLGDIFRVVLVTASDKKCVIKILERTTYKKLDYYLHLVVAPTKMNERFEWFLEKATEIGIHEITPIICEHSERKTVKTDRYYRIIEAAMKQSLQAFLPKLNDPISFDAFIKESREGFLYIAHCGETDKKILKEVIKPATYSTILIGPEGDFSTREIKMAEEQNYIPITLGTNRLRTETAALVACHSVSFINE